MRESGFPHGWDEERVRSVLVHYEQQTEVEAVAEDESTFDKHILTTMDVPDDLVPAVRKLIAMHHNTDK